MYRESICQFNQSLLQCNYVTNLVWFEFIWKKSIFLAIKWHWFYFLWYFSIEKKETWICCKLWTWNARIWKSNVTLWSKLNIQMITLSSGVFRMPRLWISSLIRWRSLGSFVGTYHPNYAICGGISDRVFFALVPNLASFHWHSWKMLL